MRRVVGRFMRMVGGRTCEDVVAVVDDYLEGRLEPMLDTIIGRHLEGCPDCEAFVRTYETVIRLTGELRADDLPDEVCLRVRSALRERYDGSR